MSRTVELVESLISELDCKKFKAQIEEISEAKFITSFYQLEKLKRTNEQKCSRMKEEILKRFAVQAKYVSLKESVPSSMAEYFWVLDPIQPDFCDKLFDQKEKLNAAIIVQNFMTILKALIGRTSLY